MQGSHRLQHSGLKALTAGRPSTILYAAWEAGFGKFLRHRTGHGIGLEGHESPWIGEGDKTVLREGMTFSCEPGVYDPDFGGFRHSDTVVVRKERGESLNHYPTRLEEMVIEI